MDKAALILVTYNNYDLLIKAITSIYLHTDSDKYDLFIIDNNSEDETKNLSNKFLINTKIIHLPNNTYWAGGINHGLSLTKEYKYTFFLNDDIEVYHDWLDNHLRVLDSNPSIGAVGPLNSSLRDWQNYNKVRQQFKLQNTLPDISNNSNLETINNKIANISPSYLLIKGMLAFFCVGFKTKTINLIGPLDEEFIMGGDDDAYCRELEKHNYSLALLLNTYVMHEAGVSINKLDSQFKKQIKENNIKLLKQKYPNYYN